MRFSLRPKRVAKFLIIFLVLGCFVPAPPLASAYGSNIYGQCAYGKSCPAGSGSLSKTSAAAGSSANKTQAGSESGQLTISPSSPHHKGMFHGHSWWWWFFLFLIILALILFFWFLLAAWRRRKDEDEPPVSHPPVSLPSPPDSNSGVVVG